MPRRLERGRSRGVTFVGLLLGGLLAVVAGAQPWWRAAGGGVSVAFSGTQATGGLSQALAVVVLAGTLLVLVLKARGRRVVALLLAVVGVAALLVGALRLRPTADAVRTRIREVSLIDQYALSPTLWPEVFAVAGLVVVGAAALLWWGAPAWPVRQDRFERAPVDPLATAADDPAGVWKALDAGQDPTADPEDPTTGPEEPATDPGEPAPVPGSDVHIGAAEDTMGANKRSDRPTRAAAPVRSTDARPRG